MTTTDGDDRVEGISPTDFFNGAPSDDQAFERLLKSLEPLFRGPLRHLSVSPALRAGQGTEDWHQHIRGELASLFRSRASKKPIGSIRAWTLTTAGRRRVDVTRRGQRRIRSVQTPGTESGSVAGPQRVDPGTAASERVRRREDAEHLLPLLRHALAGLPEVDTEIIRLRIWKELRWTEIAESVGKSEDACRMAFHRAMSRLRKTLEGGQKKPGRS